MNINQLKVLLKKFELKVTYNEDLKKKTGLILVEKQKFFLKLMS